MTARMAGEPPEAIVVTWTKRDWEERWPQRVEAMFANSLVKKATFAAALLKSAVIDYEKTGRIAEPVTTYRAKKKR